MTPELYEAVASIARHCWRGIHWEKGPKGPRPVREPLKRQHLERHINGGPGVGLAPIAPGESTTRVAVLDMDSHKGEVSWEAMAEKARELCARLEMNGAFAPIPFRSSGGKGIHIVMLWDEPQDAYSVRLRLSAALNLVGLKPGTKGVKHGEVEIFPKQDDVPADGLGNMFVLPLTGESLPLDPITLELKGYDYAEQMCREWPKSAPVPVLDRPVHPSSTIDPASSATSLAELRSALQAIPNEGDASLDYDAWRDVIFALHHATGGSDAGLALALEWSAKSTKHDEAFLTERVWPYVRSDRGGKVITAASLFKRARDAGWEEDVASQFMDLGPLDREPPLERALRQGDRGLRHPASATQHAAGPAAPETSSGKLDRFKVQSLGEFANRPPAEWIVRGVLPKAELVLIIGESGAGKSFLAWDLTAAIARGAQWRNYKTRQGRVVYVLAEGQHFFHQRAIAYGKHHDVSLGDLQIGVISDAPNLLQKDDVKALVTQLKAFGKVDVVIIDTLAQATAGGNENAAEDMGRALAHCKAIHRATGATVVLVHHVGKDETKGARGWSGIKAAADAEITVVRRDPQRIATITKMKDGPDGVTLPFRLIDVELGEDAEGERLWSCVVAHDEASAARNERTPSGPVAKLAWVSIKALVEVGGEAHFNDVIDDVVPQLPHDDTKRDKRRERARQAVDGLRDGGWINMHNNVITLK